MMDWKKACWLFLLIVLFPLHLLAEENYWIFFSDKGEIPNDAGSLQKAIANSLSYESVWRRTVRGTPGRAFDERDLPVNRAYIDRLRDLGVQIRHQSRWLNAVSITCDEAQLTALKTLPFVKRIEPVSVYRRNQLPEDARLKKIPGQGPYEYGPSLAQLEMLGVPTLHQIGFSGKGILIALLDSGFRYHDHIALKKIHVVAERDFVFHDSNTQDEYREDSPGQHNHGTMVLSVIGGYYPGWLIGPAYRASFVLAKTEYVPTETRIEEDNWVAGLEWADSLGADIVSTSLGYRDFDDGFAYTYQDLNGETMIPSIAAKTAVEKGIVVVASAGNEGNNANWPYVISPAEGKGVIAVGAVDREGERVSFSSIGPTADGRIKPDVMAMGRGVTAVVPNDTAAVFSSASGTSFSAPLVAGVCALILEANPNMTPQEVWQALTSTASQAEAPDNYYGYGIVNAVKAAEWKRRRQGKFELSVQNVKISQDNGAVAFLFDMPESGDVRITFYNILGQRVSSLVRYFFVGANQITWFPPADLSSALYFARFETGGQSVAKKFVVVK